MDTIEIFGNPFTLVNQISDKDEVTLGDDKVVIQRHWKKSKTLLTEFLSDLLHEKILELSKQIEVEGKVGLLGELDFEIRQKIDSKKNRIAKLKGNTILVKLNAVALPETALKYIIIHELAHTTLKRHSEKFWKTVETLYPEYIKAQGLLQQYENKLNSSLLF
jgi:predicted metal-dependent hydrolase